MDGWMGVRGVMSEMSWWWCGTAHGANTCSGVYAMDGLDGLGKTDGLTQAPNMMTSVRSAAVSPASSALNNALIS